MPLNENDLNKLKAFNAGLSAALPTLGLALEIGRMVYDLIKSGPDNTKAFDEHIATIHAAAGKLQQTSADWFAANPEFDPATGKRRP